MRRVCVFLLLAFLAPAFCGALHAGEPSDADLRQILAKPEYNRWRSTVGEGSSISMGDYDFDLSTPSWLENLLERLRKWLESRSGDDKRPEREYRARDPAAAIGFFSSIGYVLLAIAAIFLAFAVYLQLRDRMRIPVIPDAARRVGIAKALEDGDALAYGDDEWRKQAERFMDEGDVRLAYRSLYLGLLSGLHEQGRIVFVQNRTNWHYVKTFRGEVPARKELADMTDLFDRVWYGLIPVLDSGGMPRTRERVAALLEGGQRHA